MSGFWGGALSISNPGMGWRCSSGVVTGSDGFTKLPDHGVSDGISDLEPRVETPGSSKKGDADEGSPYPEHLPEPRTEEVPIEF